ncbi:hypothetical protein ACSSZE_05765 [Acidithiobacillus caldus]
MHLIRLFSDTRFSVVAVEENGECPALKFVTMRDKQYGASRKGLFEMLRRAAIEGLEGFSTSMCHEADKGERIFQFVKGDLRLLFFKGKDGELIVCVGGHIKKGQKASQLEVARAARLRKQYLEAKKTGAVVIVE